MPRRVFRHFSGPLFSTFRHQIFLRLVDFLDIDVDVINSTINQSFFFKYSIVLYINHFTIEIIFISLFIFFIS